MVGLSYLCWGFVGNGKNPVGGGSLRSLVLATRLSAANSPVLSLLLASCGDVNIKQTPGLWVTVLTLGIEALPESAYLNHADRDLP